MIGINKALKNFVLSRMIFRVLILKHKEDFYVAVRRYNCSKLRAGSSSPFATRQLADLGARVIKIERPNTGDFARNYDTTVHGMSSHFVWLNRSKESVCLDLKQEESTIILDKILSQADVFVQNLAPGAVDRLGFSPSILKEKYPQLIICGISGYGSNGSYRDKKAYDLLIQCEAGLVSITGTDDNPSKSGISIADIAAGMYAYTGILTALLARHKQVRVQSLKCLCLRLLRNGWVIRFIILNMGDRSKTDWFKPCYYLSVWSF